MLDVLAVGESGKCDVLSEGPDWSFRRVSESLDEQFLSDGIHRDVDRRRRTREQTHVHRGPELGQHLVVPDQHLR